ncbi:MULTISPECIES: AbrB/MazE/SpoVT family DNA-binding domain-containing protein [unclassified Candidatus Frackibacter]|uniref:AbrB/MazE/SpoVT family DNA-binding domain-containing protein n=1 Tax=unclassified Candidatus Frackibacter TaxID=2648818 RepID=UPI00088AA657|nr:MULTISPECIES: AbrB/MazE/SpoVT family DNA-binding domain-containing protein [unclassified Candidatus Frackibacter]SDC46736.1 transcriptional pleiotropic regulator of transition state genes [Candidatus Frackibacter sp. WG11]SEM81838.1 transcriptional pleiotropic regulator of transition state genes [Candidatus Frackibacter sp. WG12]SFL72182.1 transcriptional pleiotropic regulator of transition state genes [Candidatus Frackibacter sp. WG13]
MEGVGIVREVDKLGRVVLPAELREKLDIESGEPLKIFIDETEGEIILQKFQLACVFCDEAEDVIRFKGKIVCKACLNKILEK